MKIDRDILFLLLGFVLLIILFAYREGQLETYSEWYCQTIYGLDKNCNER